MFKTLDFLGVALVAEALFFIALGASVLVRRRPVLVQNRWFVALIGLSILPSAFSIWQTPGAFRHVSHGVSQNFAPHLDTMLAPVLLVMALVVLFMSVVMRGYSVYGATEDTVRNALCSALDRLRLPYEESLSGLRLPSIGATITTTIQGRVGTAMLQVKPKEQNAILRSVVREMRSHFQTTPGDLNLMGSAMNVAMGGLLLVMAIGFVGFTGAIRHLDPKIGNFDLKAFEAFESVRSRPFRVPGAAPAARKSPLVRPDLVGVWEGTLGSSREEALLVIPHQNGGRFDGTLISRTIDGYDRVRFVGTFTRDGSIQIRETKLAPGSSRNWTLGRDTGFFSPDGLTLAGSGSDRKGEHYLFQFTHQSHGLDYSDPTHWNPSHKA